MPADSKKLIELGWDIPDTAVLRRQIDRIEQSPFDGVIFFAFYARPDGKSGNLSREAWGRTELSAAAMQPAIDDLKATPFRRLTENFLRVDMIPADVDWFEDYAPINRNLRLAATVARNGGARGIFLDVEQYKGRLFDYQRQNDRRSRSFKEYTEQARKRGREVMRALQDGYPDLTVLLSHGHSFLWQRRDGGRNPLENMSYDLLPGFLDGLFDGAAGKTCLIDGFEPAYYFDRPEQFEDAYRLIRQGTLPSVGNKRKYQERVKVGFGLWLDRDWEKRGGWNEQDFSRNYFSPDTLQKLVTKALQKSDKYVWLYSQKLNWYQDEHIPTAYREALMNARRDGS